MVCDVNTHATTPPDKTTKASKSLPHVSQEREWADAKMIHHIFGICKSTLYRLDAEGKIRSSSLRERGKLRGKKLFSILSVSAFIEKMATGEEGKS